MFTMKVPVFAKPVSPRDSLSGQKLKIWRNGEEVWADAPVAPNVYMPHLPASGSSIATKIEPVLLKPMSTREESIWYRLDFRTTYDRDFFIEHVKSPDYEGESVRPVNTTDNFIDETVQKAWGFMGEYAQTKPLTVMVFDIEQYTDGSGVFPKPSETVISVAYTINDEEPVFVESNGRDDFNVIKAFANALQTHDPDIIVGYNHCDFDMRVMVAKFEEHGFNMDLFGREKSVDGNRKPFFYSKKIGPRDMICCTAPGRIYYDVYHAAVTDQTLHGLRRGLKDVSTHFWNESKTYRLDAPNKPIQEDTSNTSLLMGTPELKEYNESDVIHTRALFKLYFPNNVAAAESVHCPLNRVVPMATSYTFTQHLGAGYHQRNILPDTTNMQRYPWAYAAPYDDKEGAFEGGYVRSYKVGYTPNVEEADVNSMYPSIIIGLGIGPDNTWVEGTLTPAEHLARFGSNDFKVIKEGNLRTYYVPDEKRGWSWIIKVDGWSFLAPLLNEFMQKRMEIKREYGRTNDTTLYAQSYGLKVIINSAYGVTGSKFSAFADLGVAALTTACGREILKEAHRFIGEDSVIICDTDGLKTTNTVDTKAFNKYFATYMVETMLGEPTITWGREEFSSIYVTEARKNYLLLHTCGDCDGAGCDKCDDGEVMTVHGNSLKSSQKPPLHDMVIDRVGMKVLRGMDSVAVAREALDMGRYDESDFIMSVRINKAIKDYTPTGQAYRLALLSKKETGVLPKRGDTIKYIKVMDPKLPKGKKRKAFESAKAAGQQSLFGDAPPVTELPYKFQIYNEDNMVKLDINYYREVVQTALNNMGIYLDKADTIEGMFGV